MTKLQLYAQMRDKGYSEPEFFAELDETESTTGTVARLIYQIEVGKDIETWMEILKLHDEFSYFSELGDEYIVCNEV